MCDNCLQMLLQMFKGTFTSLHFQSFPCHPVEAIMVRAKAPTYDQGVIDSFCRSDKMKWGSFGKYEHLSKSQAPDGDSLASFHPWLSTLIQAAPSLEFSSTAVFKKELIRMATTSDISSGSKLRGDLWANDRADRLLTICYHMRRIKRDGGYELQKIAQTSTGESLQVLKAMLNKMVVSDNVPLPLVGHPASAGLYKMAPTTTRSARVAPSVAPSLAPSMASESDGEAIGASPKREDMADPEVAEPDHAEPDQSQAEEEEEPVEDAEDAAMKPLLFDILYPEAKAGKPRHRKRMRPMTPSSSHLHTPSPAPSEVATTSGGGVYYRKEFYKARNGQSQSVGFKRFCQAKKAGKQIGSISSKWLSKDQLQMVGEKTLASLASGQDEERCMLLAKLKVQKMEMAM